MVAKARRVMAAYRRLSATRRARGPLVAGWWAWRVVHATDREVSRHG